MNTEIIKICENENKNRAELGKASAIIKNGGLVVFPTETVYGLGADATNAEAVKKIYVAKGRPSDNPLIIHIARPEDAELYTYTNSLYYSLAKRFMPGPITVILKSKETVPLTTRGGLDTVAVRCPENSIARELIRLSETAIAAPSANISGTPSPTAASHVIKDMTGRVDVIIDGGDAEIGLESTIVKIDGDDSVTLLRPGKITVDDLLTVVNEVRIADAVTDKLKEGERALSPGMKYRHYAPKAELVLLDADFDEFVDFVSQNASDCVAVIAYSDILDKLSGVLNPDSIFDLGSFSEKNVQARRLFDILRKTDEGSYKVIYAPLPDKSGIGLALYNRMIRAAAHKIIDLRR